MRRASAMAMSPRALTTVAEERPPALGRSELRVLWGFLRPRRRALIIAAATMLLASALKFAGPLLLRYAVDLGIQRHDWQSLNLFGTAFVLAAAVGFVALRAAAILAGRTGEQALREMRVAAFRHLLSLSMGFFERERSGRLVARISTDIEAIEQFITDTFTKIATEILFILGAAVVLAFLDWRLALAALSVLPVMAGLTVFFRRRSDRIYRRVRERVASVLSFLQETLRGVHVVQAFATERRRLRRFHEVNNDWVDASAEAFRLEALYFPTVQFIGVIGTAAALIYGGNRVIDGNLSPGTLTAFVVYLALFFEPLHHMSELYARFQQAMAGTARVAQLLAVEPQIADAPGARPLPAVEGRIALEGVCFAYRPGGAEVLHDVSITAAPGETIALVGPTGAGKSTIVKLLARFYDPGEGKVTIDGFEVREVTAASLHGQVALVPQEGFLFAGTVRENIRFGRPGATDEEVEEVAQRIGIDGFVGSLPRGYETEVHERGARLAAGERQLIALARALLAHPRLILLDEATSSLDSSTEFRVERAFRRALEGRTAVIIAHRLSTVMDADRIYVIDEGRVVEEGSHHELVLAGGRYAALYRSWLAPAA